MANNLQTANATVSAGMDAVTALLNSGYFRIYDGSQPSNADTAIGTQVLLAELRFGNPAFAAAVNGIANANAITDDSSANASGTASWFRLFKSDGTTVVMDGTVGVGSFDLSVTTTSIVAGDPVSIPSFQLTLPESQ